MKKLLLLFLVLVPSAAFSAGEIVAVAHPKEKLPGDKTVVWTPLFQAAWDDLNQGLGAPVTVNPPNALMERLDHFKWDATAVMPRDRWKVWSGDATQELIDKANAETAQMLGVKKGPFKSEPQPDSRLALGLLDRDMVFKKPLHRPVSAALEFSSADGRKSQVRFFGSRGKASAGYDGVVSVLAYQAGTHALQIASDGDDCAVLYLPEKPVSFSEACGKLREWRANPLGDLYEMDDVRIPVLKLVNTTDFVTDLQGLRQFKDGPPWRISKADQRLRFQLTEKGAKLRVEVELAATLSAKPKPRFFHYDRPFFVFLWRDGAEWPYFGAWIGNDASMEAFKEVP